MPSSIPLTPSDILGFSRLAIDATVGMTGVVEAMHGVIGASALHRIRPEALAYACVRGVTRLVGSGIGAALRPLVTAGEAPSSPEREALIAAVNGILGDHLAATRNPLAIPMRLRRAGRALDPCRDLARGCPRPSGRIVVLVHGLCMNDLQWDHNGHNHGIALERDLGRTSVYLHYNSGLHVSANGRAFDALMEDLIKQWPMPVQEIAIICHSIGGLVARSAMEYGMRAKRRWTRRVRKMVFLATPHHGSALERVGNLVNIGLGVNPYSAPLARIAGIRSAGITDLRYGNVLDEHWEGRDRFQHLHDLRTPVPLPKGVRCFAVAASIGRNHAIGDGLVSVGSALGRHRDEQLALGFAKSNQWVGYGLNHRDVLSHPAVYKRLRQWLESPGRTRVSAQ